MWYQQEKSEKLKPPHFGKSPWLLYIHGGNSKHKQIQTFYSVSYYYEGCYDDEVYVKSIPQLRGKKILASFHGWLILQDLKQFNLFSLFNLFTLQAITLPPLLLATVPDTEWVSACALTLSPECVDSVLLLCFNEAGLMFSCRPAQTDCTWVAQRLEMEGELVQVKDLVSLNGVIYGRTTHCHNDLFFIEDDSVLLTLLPLQIRLDLGMPSCIDYQTYLLESCGGLYIVTLSRRCEGDYEFIGMKIYQIDLDAKIWVEVKCLDGRAFFISKVNCTWAWDSADIRGNSVYLLTHDDEVLYRYTLSDRTWTQIALCEYLVPPHVRCPNAVWVVPPQPQHSDRWLVRRGSEENIKKLDFPDQRADHPIIECREFPESNETQENIISKLPLHVIELISDYLHVFDYRNLQATCKILRSSLPTRQWKTTNTDEPPLFMVFYEGECRLMDPFRLESQTYRNLFPLPLQHHCRLKFPKYKWVRYVVGKKHLKFMDEATRVKGDFLGRLCMEECDVYDDRIRLFSKYTTCSQCKKVSIHRHLEFLAFCFHELGNEAWKKFFFNHKNTVVFCPRSTAPVFVGGKFYFLDKFCSLGVFELVDGQLHFQVFNRPEHVEFLRLSYLVECAGEVYSVMGRYWWLSVCVFRFDNLKKDWVEIECLGNHNFFVSSASSFARVTKDPKMRNMIYLPFFESKAFACYSLDTKQLKLIIASQEDTWDARNQPHCCWI